MSIARRKLPVVPKGVDVNLLNANLKLYSNEVIAVIKQQFQENGRYREYVNQDGLNERLPYPVFVFNGRYVAGYPGKELRLGEEDHGVKLAQDLDSGEWVIEKVLKVLPDGEENPEYVTDALDVDWERQMLRERNMAVMANNEEMYLSRSFTERAYGEEDYAEEDAGEGNSYEEGIVEFNQSASEGDYSAYDGFAVSSQTPSYDIRLESGDEVSLEDRVGKHYLFMQRAPGASLHEWAERELPLIVRLEMSQALARVLMAWHDEGYLHRDVKDRNAVYDMIRNSLNMIDVGMSVHTEEKDEDLYSEWGTPGFMAPEITGGKVNYSEKSDIYAFGITLGVMWGFIEINKIDVDSEVKYQAVLADQSSLELPEKLQREMRSLIVSLTNKDPLEREALKDVVKSLRRMQDKLSEADREIQVAVVDAGEYLNARNDGFYQQHYLEDLSSYDMLQLLNVNGELLESELLVVKQDLEAAGMVVDGEVYVANLQAMQNHMEDLNAARPESGRIYRYSIECQRQEMTLTDSGNSLKDLEEGKLKADPVAKAIQHAYHAPVALRQRRNPVEGLERVAVRQDDVRLQMRDVPDEPTPRERRDARYEQAEEYNWGDWAAWFFGNMAEDSCELFNAVVDNSMQNLSCFSMFRSCMPSEDPLSPSVTRRLRDQEREDPYAGTEMTRFGV